MEKEIITVQVFNRKDKYLGDVNIPKGSSGSYTRCLIHNQYPKWKRYLIVNVKENE